jgi:hypothetical protein
VAYNEMLRNKPDNHMTIGGGNVAYEPDERRLSFQRRHFVPVAPLAVPIALITSKACRSPPWPSSSPAKRTRAAVRHALRHSPGGHA